MRYVLYVILAFFSKDFFLGLFTKDFFLGLFTKDLVSLTNLCFPTVQSVVESNAVALRKMPVVDVESPGILAAAEVILAEDFGCLADAVPLQDAVTEVQLHDPGCGLKLNSGIYQS